MAELVSATLSDRSADCSAVYLFHERVRYCTLLCPTRQRPFVTTITIWSISNRCWNRRSCDLGYIDHGKIVAGFVCWKGSTTMNKPLVLTALGLFLAVHVAVALIV